MGWPLDTNGGSLTSTGDVTITSDSDASGAGDIILKVGATEIGRFAAAGGGVFPVGTTAHPLQFTGVPYFGNAARDGSGSLVVMDDTNNTAGVIEWECNATNSGEMIHLTGGPNMAGSAGSGPNLIALGVNFGGVGLFINNYTIGVGLKITNRSTGSNAAAWGFLLSQSSTFAEGMYLSQETSTAKMPFKIVNAPIGSVGGGGASTNQILSEWRRSQAATGDTLLVRFLVDSALFQVPVTISQAALTVSGAGITGDSISANATGAFLEVFDQGGTANQRRFKWKQSSTHLLIQKVTDAGVGSTLLDIDQSGNITYNDAANLIFGTATGTKIGTVGGAAGQKIGFWNATPVVQPLLATGAAHTVDDVITTLQTLGLVRQS